MLYSLRRKDTFPGIFPGKPVNSTVKHSQIATKIPISGTSKPAQFNETRARTALQVLA